MRGLGSVVVVLVSLLSLDIAAAQDSPEQVVRSIYATYENGGLGVSPTDPDVQHAFSGRMRILLDEERRRIARNGLGLLDFDVFVDGQDFDVSDLKIGKPLVNGDKARLDISLMNMGEPRQFRFHFVREMGGWRIDEMETLGTGMPWRLSRLLAGN
mgnify:CR=1 FL=1